MNHFDLLLHDNTEDKSTNNLPRKLAKMKRKYEINPTEDLKNRIDELEKKLNPPKSKKNKKKNKKKEEDIDIEEAFQENRDYWFKYWKDEEERKRKIKEEKERIEEERRRNKRNRKKEEKEYERQYYDSIKRAEEKERVKMESLPDDIKEFISNEPSKKLYHKLCLKYHPDKGGGNDEYFKFINNYMNP
jgi:hypothetical protein